MHESVYSPYEARIAVLEAYREQNIADMHELRDDVKAGNRLTTANLVVFCVGLLGVIGALLAIHR